MKKILLTCFALSIAVLAYAKGSVKLDDTVFNLDTVFHAQVGPGTTQTSLHLVNSEDATKKMRVFYLTIDLQNPYIGFKAVLGQDKLAGGQTVSSMATSNTTDNRICYAGVNTDFFLTSGTATNGKSMVGTPLESSAGDGEIFRTGESSFWLPNFYFDENGQPNIEVVTYSNGTAECNGQTVSFSVVNNDAEDNTVSVYTPRYYGIMNQPGLAGSVAEVTAKLIDGDKLAFGQTTKLEVTATATSTGDREIPDGEYLIAGRGTAMAFVNNLQVGDVVSLTPQANTSTTTVKPQQMCMGNPLLVQAGKKIVSRSTSGDRHPRTAIGYTADKKTLVMMIIDGRSNLSIGAELSEIADMMLYTGIYDAVNLDGGGSSTLYTQALGVRNDPSDGHERADASAMFCVANVPASDKTVTSIKFVDWAMLFPKYGIYTPKFYGYNQYGMLVDTDLQGVTLSCDSKIGEITQEGTTFYGTGEGTGALTASYNGMTASIPVTVAQNDNVALRLNNVTIDNRRSYPIEVQAWVVDEYMPLNSAALAWNSSDASVASVGADTGVLKGVANGTATVTGTVGSFTGDVNVTVEIADAATMPVLRTFPAADEWTLKQTGGTGLAIAQMEDGFRLNYTGNGSSRGAYISLAKDIQVWSLPESLIMNINPGDASIKKLSINAKNALGEKVSGWAPTVATFPANTETQSEFKLSDWCDPDDIGIYPITIESIRFDMNASAKGTDFQISVPAFKAKYWAEDGSVESRFADKAGASIYPNPVQAGNAVTVKAQGDFKAAVYSVNGAKVAEYTGCDSVSVPTEGLKGIYVVAVTTDGGRSVSKLIVR